ncbi:hypothetical protein V6N11_008570 [Hibiscus sabdariffa]|uniref:Uncharacterized protein n=2 Tax=Hibiscus sabdariffa TaxID=183260 RepID=A0ABR2A2Y5_9ROSI
MSVGAHCQIRGRWFRENRTRVVGQHHVWFGTIRSLFRSTNVLALALGGPVRGREAITEGWDKWFGMADKVMGSELERFDVVWCEPALEQLRVSQVVLRGRLRWD